MKSRCSIKSYNQPFIQQLQSETGIDDLTDLVNYILTDYKRFRVASDHLLFAPPVPQQTEAPVKQNFSDDIAGLLG